MKVSVNGEVKDLIIIDAKTGCEWTQDFIGGCDDFTWDTEAEILTCSEEAFDWWEEHAAAWQKMDELKAELAQEHGWDVVMEVVNDCGYNEFNDMPAIVTAALKEVFKVE